MISFFNKRGKLPAEEISGQTPSVIGNYRIIRTLHESDRAIISLAQEMTGDPGMLARQSFMTSGELQGLVALKIYRPAVHDEQIAIEADALDSLRGPGVVELLDVLDLTDGTKGLVMRALRGPLLVELWESRGSLSPGEMVTILASLVATLARISSSGYAHGAVWPGNIRFDDFGRPVLTGFSSARKHAPQNSDWLDFYSVLRGCAMLASDKQEQMMQISTEMRKRLDPFDPELPAWLEASLFRLADPQPIRLDNPILFRDGRAKTELPDRSGDSGSEKSRIPKILMKVSGNKYVAPALQRLRRPVVLFTALFAFTFVVLLMVIPVQGDGDDTNSVVTQGGDNHGNGNRSGESATGQLASAKGRRIGNNENDSAVSNPKNNGAGKGNTEQSNPVKSTLGFQQNSNDKNESRHGKSQGIKGEKPQMGTVKPNKPLKRSDISEQLRKNIEACLASKDPDCVDVLSEINAELGEVLDR